MSRADAPDTASLTLTLDGQSADCMEGRRAGPPHGESLADRRMYLGRKLAVMTAASCERGGVRQGCTLVYQPQALGTSASIEHDRNIEICMRFARPSTTPKAW